MEWLDSNFLTVLIAFPLIWACIGLLIPTATESGQNTLKVYSFVGSALLFALSLKLYFLFDSAGPEFQAVERSEWIPLLGIQYHVGIDGLSLWLVLLTTALMPIVLLGSFHAVEMRHREYYFLLMALETGMIGAFVSLDVFLFYVFWELMLIPMYFLIGIWGSKDRVYAAMKFFLYTMVGSLLMLVAIFLPGVSTQATIWTVFYCTYRLVQTFHSWGWIWICASDSLFGVCSRFCNQSAFVSAPHLASRCARSSPNFRICYFSGCTFEARWLWIYAVCLPSFSSGGPPVSVPVHVARNHSNYLRRVCCVGAA
jgi:NADH:ubiquinone oxidoreductase subunit 4 (subunit M)